MESLPESPDILGDYRLNFRVWKICLSGSGLMGIEHSLWMISLRITEYNISRSERFICLTKGRYGWRSRYAYRGVGFADLFSAYAGHGGKTSHGSQNGQGGGESQCSIGKARVISAAGSSAQPLRPHDTLRGGDKLWQHPDRDWNCFFPILPGFVWWELPLSNTGS